MALPSFSFLQRPPHFGITLVGWLHLQLEQRDVALRRVAKFNPQVQKRRSLVQPREEIRPGIQQEPNAALCLLPLGCSPIAASLFTLRTAQSVHILAPW